MRRLALGFVLTLAALGGCRARDNDPGPGGVTVGEAHQLDEAAARLESRPQARRLAPAPTAQPSPEASARN